MTTTAPTELPATHKHEGGRPPEHAFPVMLVVSLLVLTACTAFAVVMTNGPDGRAAAEAITPATVSGATEVTVGAAAPSDGVAPRTTLQFSASMPSGPIVIGQPGTIVVTVTNPYDEAIRLDELSVMVGDPSEPGCLADWFSIGDYSASVDSAVAVPPGESARIRVPYTLVDLVGTNQDACKGVTFPLSITGSGRPV
jgi:hypothetical protein